MPVIREPYKMFAACLNFYRSNPVGAERVRKSAMFAHIQEALRNFLAGLSTIHEGAYPGWKADDDHPGYMIRIDPPAVMRAPYHMVCAFPSEASLDAIWHLSREVKTLATSVLCLSGSVAVMKSSLFICDIDFCEYIASDCEDVIAALTSKMRGGEELIFRRIHVGAGNAGQVGNAAELATQLRAVRPADPDYSHAKVDFIGKPNGMRPTEVSNVIIFCDENWRSASLHRSFAAQEAHLDPVVAVPNMLCEPYEIGRYIAFLLDQAHQYAGKGDFAKALKRCLSLARLCFLANVSENITMFIAHSPDFLEREITAVDELIAELSRSNIDFPEWAEELDNARYGLAHDLTMARRRQPGETIGAFCRRTLVTLDLALAGKDLKAA